VYIYCTVLFFNLLIKDLKSYSYLKLNFKHILWYTMKSKTMNDETIIKILEQNNNILKKYKVKRIGLFGSYARGQQKKNSDIDLLVEFDLNMFGKDYQGLYDTFSELSHYLENLFGKKVDLIPDDSLSPYIKAYVNKDIKWYET